MKIPFDIKYRPQIESGEYKVETRDGRPAKIVSFEMTDTNNCPVAAQFRLCAGTTVVYLFDKDGYYRGEGPSDYDLFIVTPEKEMTEFENRLCEILDSAINLQTHSTPEEIIRNAKELAPELLAIARKELEPEVLERLEEVYKNQDDVVYENGKRDGKAEALKDLPRWVDIRDFLFAWKSSEETFYDRTLGQLYHKGKKLFISDLENLPGFKEEKE